MTEPIVETGDHAAARGARRSATAALLICLVGFGGLGMLLQAAAGHGSRKAPIAMPSEIVPAQVGDWTFVGETEGWLSQGYPIGHTLYRYRRGEGASLFVTAAVGQERYGAFANLAPIFLQRGHELTATLPRTMQEPGTARPVRLRVSQYHPTAEEGPFTFAGLYWNGRRVTTSLGAVKAGVTLRRAIGMPQPTVACYFYRPMADAGEREQAAADIAEFAQAFLPTIEELRAYYAGS